MFGDVDCIISASLSVGQPVCPEVYCGKTAAVWSGEWDQSRNGRIRWGGYCQRGMGSFWGKCGVSHYNQWKLCCVVVQKRHAFPKLLWRVHVIPSVLVGSWLLSSLPGKQLLNRGSGLLVEGS